MAGNSGAVRAGRAFVELFTNNNALYRGLDDAAKRLKSWGASVAKLGGGVGGAGAVMGAPLLGLFKQATDRGTQIDTMSKRFGATAEQVSGLAFAFERAGVTTEEFGDTLTALDGRFKAAADGGDELLRRLRLNDRVMVNLPWAERIDLLADAFARVKNPADQAAVAQELFGGAGLKMLDVLKRGSAGLKEQVAVGKQLGAVWGGAEVKQATAVTRAWVDVQLALKYAALEAGRALLGESAGVGELRDRLVSGITAGREWLRENRTLVVTVAKLAGGMVLAGAALVAMGLGLKVAGAAVGGVVVGAKLLAAGVGLVLSPVGLLTAGVVALGVAWATQTDAGKQMLADLGAGFVSMAETAKEAWGGIVNALKRGDLEAAFGVITAGIELEWRRLIVTLTAAWNAFKVTFKDSWSEITKDFADVLARIVYSGPELKQIRRNLEEDEVNRRDANNAGRQADIDKANARLREAQARFNAIVAAELAKPVPGGKDLPHELQKKKDEVADKIGNMKAFDSVKGTFALTTGQGQFGYADSTAKRALDAQLAVAKNAAELPAIRKGIDDMNEGMRLI